MKILHLSKYYHPYRGGIETTIKEVAECAVGQGHEVTVVCSSENGQRSEEYINQVRVIRLPKWATVFSQPMTPSAFWDLRKYIRESDVVHLHTPNPLFELATLFLSSKQPFIVSYHCEVMKARALNNIYKPISRSVLNRADKIIVATQYHIEYSRWLKEFEHKCEVIPFGIDPKYQYKTLEINEHLHEIKSKYDRYFLFVGRMVPYKGVAYLLKAMQEVQQNLVLIGKGPLLESMRNLSVQLKVDHKTHFMGAVEDDNQFAAYLHGCDSLVLASVNEAEAFGLVLLEAMSCKKPVITSNLKSGVRAVNIPGETGLVVPPANSKALAKAMNHMASDHQMRQHMGENAIHHFQQKFLAENCFRNHHRLYQSLLQKSPETVALPLAASQKLAK